MTIRPTPSSPRAPDTGMVRQLDRFEEAVVYAARRATAKRRATLRPVEGGRREGEAT